MDDIDYEVCRRQDMDGLLCKCDVLEWLLMPMSSTIVIIISSSSFIQPGGRETK